MMYSGKSLVPVKELLEVQIERTSVRLRDDTAVGSELTIVHIVDACASGLIHSDSGIESELEILEEVDLHVSCSIYSITLAVVRIESNCLESIGIT